MRTKASSRGEGHVILLSKYLNLINKVHMSIINNSDLTFHVM